MIFLTSTATIIWCHVSHHSHSVLLSLSLWLSYVCFHWYSSKTKHVILRNSFHVYFGIVNVMARPLRFSCSLLRFRKIIGGNKRSGASPRSLSAHNPQSVPQDPDPGSVRCVALLSLSVIQCYLALQGDLKLLLKSSSVMILSVFLCCHGGCRSAETKGFRQSNPLSQWLLHSVLFLITHFTELS